MSKTGIALLCGLTFVIGVIAGGGVLASFYGSFIMEPSLANSAAAEAGNKLVVLQSLRGGETDKAVTLLETTLDSDLVVLGLMPDSVIDPQKSRLLRRVADYRTRFPHKSGEPTVDAAISTVLSKHRGDK